MSGDGGIGPPGPVDFRSGPHAGVAPSSGGFGGGALNRARRPTDVQGGFSVVKAGADTPTDASAARVVEARNDRGSNVRIPYARLTPMHGKDKLPVDGHYVYEYSGLQSGELAWIMSKTFVANSGAAYTHADGTTEYDIASALQHHAHVSSHGAIGPIVRARKDDDDGSLMHQEGPSLGFGVDRMQRLAFTGWVEALFRRRLGRQVIDMCKFDLGDKVSRALESTLDDYGMLITGASLFAVPDLTYALEYKPPNTDSTKEGQTTAPLLQGLFLLEPGPFLRSMGASNEPSTLRVPLAAVGPTADSENEAYPPGGAAYATYQQNLYADDSDWKKTTISMSFEHGVPRHLGGELAQRGLYVLLKKHGVFNWTPDGVVLSKLETGPSPEADAHVDARQGQLFNVAIQGPAITKTWAGDAKMICQPMDRVFVLVVGDIDYTLVPSSSARWTSVKEGKREVDANEASVPDDEGTSYWCKQVSVECREIMREGSKQLHSDGSDVAAARNTPLGKADAAGATDTEELQAAFGGEKSVALRNALYELRKTAMRREKKTLDTQGKLYELLRQYRTRAEHFDQALRRPGATVNSPHVQKWYDNTATYQTGHNKDGEDSTRDNHCGVKQLLSLIKAAMTGFSQRKSATDARRNAFSKEFADAQSNYLQGQMSVGRAMLTNLRLMRCTSSYLAERAYPEESDPHSRLGLSITYEKRREGDVDGSGGVTSFVLGGWCVGTVLDSAASRAMQVSVVRASAHSMAMNVNVNIEWWSADKLHRHYGDPKSWNTAKSAEKLRQTNTVRTRSQPKTATDHLRDGKASTPEIARRHTRVASTADTMPPPGEDMPRIVTARDDGPDSDVGRLRASDTWAVRNVEE